MCLLLAHQCHSTSVAGGGKAALSAITCLASFWFPSPEIGAPHKKEKPGLHVLWFSLCIVTNVIGIFYILAKWDRQGLLKCILMNVTSY